MTAPTDAQLSDHAWKAQEHNMTARAIENGNPTVFDPSAIKKTIWKIDLFFIPVMIFGYGLVYYDKAILGSAAVLGMLQDLDLSVVVNPNTKPPTTSTDRLSWATSLFYFGMLAGLYPMSLILQRFKVGHVLGPIVTLWGAVAMLTAAVTSYHGLYAQRFFLGFVESIIPVSFAYIISNFYSQQEQALRHSLWFSAAGWFTIFGGAVNYGFGHVNEGALHRWQYVYLFGGSLTILFGIFCFFMPDSPSTAWFLNHQERALAVERLRSDQTGLRHHKIKMAQVYEALRDFKYPVIFIMMASTYITNAAVSGFGPLIVTTFGWSPLDALLLQFPTGAFSGIGSVLTGFISSRIRNVLLAQLVFWAFIAIAAAAIIWKSTWSYKAAAPVVGYTLISAFSPVASLTIVTGVSNVSGATKKSLMTATIFVGYCLGNIVGPQLVKSQQKQQHYPELFEGIIICYCFVILCAIILFIGMYRENKRRDKQQLITEKPAGELALEDLTDRENPHFRYAL